MVATPDNVYVCCAATMLGAVATSHYARPSDGEVTSMPRVIRTRRRYVYGATKDDACAAPYYHPFVVCPRGYANAGTSYTVPCLSMRLRRLSPRATLPQCCYVVAVQNCLPSVQDPLLIRQVVLVGSGEMAPGGSSGCPLSYVLAGGRKAAGR